MDIASVRRLHLIATAAVSLSYWGLLCWQHLHGGVPGHSFLARDDMPRISNWWGALLLPVLSYMLTGRMQARLASATAAGSDVTRCTRAMLVAFTAALLYGAALAASVATGRSEISSLLFRTLPVIALLWPIYRAEYVFGFVLALTYTFGAVLPMVIATVIAVLSLVLHRLILYGLRRLVRKRERAVSESRAR